MSYAQSSHSLQPSTTHDHLSAPHPLSSPSYFNSRPSTPHNDARAQIVSIHDVNNDIIMSQWRDSSNQTSTCTVYQQFTDFSLQNNLWNGGEPGPRTLNADIGLVGGYPYWDHCAYSEPLCPLPKVLKAEDSYLHQTFALHMEINTRNSNHNGAEAIPPSEEGPNIEQSHGIAQSRHNTDSSKENVCSTCGMEFSRPDNKNRHERTTACGKAIARRTSMTARQNFGIE